MLSGLPFNFTVFRLGVLRIDRSKASQNRVDLSSKSNFRIIYREVVKLNGDSIKICRIYHEFAFINHFQETGLVVLNTDLVKTRQGCREDRFGADRKTTALGASIEGANRSTLAPVNTDAGGATKLMPSRS
jgi:hypothetical protein